MVSFAVVGLWAVGEFVFEFWLLRFFFAQTYPAITNRIKTNNNQGHNDLRFFWCASRSIKTLFCGCSITQTLCFNGMNLQMFILHKPRSFSVINPLVEVGLLLDVAAEIDSRAFMDAEVQMFAVAVGVFALFA